MILLINYADWRFDIKHKFQQKRQINSAYDAGIHKCIDYNREKIIKTEFYKNNKTILNQKTGVGVWLWNPYIIYNNLCRLGKQDFLVYCDCDMWFEGDISVLTKVCENNNGMFYIKSYAKNCEYTKGYCFYKMGCDNEKYYHANQVLGGFVVLKKNKFTVKLYREYYRWCRDITIIDNNFYGIGNFLGFRKHRHPQSVLSLLHKKYNLNAFEFPCVRKNRKKHKYIVRDIKYNKFEKKQNLLFKNTHILKGQGCI